MIGGGKRWRRSSRDAIQPAARARPRFRDNAARNLTSRAFFPWRAFWSETRVGLYSLPGTQLIPSPHEGDSRGGFSKRGGCDSPWQTGGGLPWLLRLGFEGITT